MKNPGTVNGFIICNVMENKKVVATCANTPNARAFAFAQHPNATHTRAHYPGWAIEEKFREEHADRIPHSGWMTADEAHYQKS